MALSKRQLVHVDATDNEEIAIYYLAVLLLQSYLLSSKQKISLV
jgi:hypothetical protein